MILSRLILAAIGYNRDTFAGGFAVALDDQTSEAESIAAELRVSIRRACVARSRGMHAHNDSDSVDGLDGALEHDLALLRSNSDVAHAPFRSHRPLTGRFIIFIRNLARELLVQLLERQSACNSAAARALTHLSRKLDQIAQEQERIAQRLDAIESMVNGATSERIDAPKEALKRPSHGLERRA